MPCRCTANTLRIFIRNVAHVDLETTSRLTSSRRPSLVAPRCLSTSTKARDPVSKRLYSSTTYSEAVPFERLHSSASKINPIPTGKTQPLSIKAPKFAGDESPFADISLDSIDALAAEALPQETPKSDDLETPLKSLYKDFPQKKNEVTRTTWKKLEPANIVRQPRAGNTNFDSDNIAIGKNSKARDDDTEWTPPKREEWMLQKNRIKEKFPDGYKPMKRLSPDAMAGIRALNAQMPEKFTTYALSQEFEVSPEAIRRILKSKWRPSSEEESDREQRWFRRGEKVWTRYTELGLKPPKKWKQVMEKSLSEGAPKAFPKANSRWTMPKTMPQLITTAVRSPTTQTDGRAEESSFSNRIL